LLGCAEEGDDACEGWGVRIRGDWDAIMMGCGCKNRGSRKCVGLVEDGEEEEPRVTSDSNLKKVAEKPILC
jgi:hypothetical protein